MVIKTVYRFVDFNLGAEIVIWRINRKRRGEFWKMFCLEGRRMTYLGERRFFLGDQRQGKLYRLTIKWTWSKTSVKDFHLHFKYTFHWLLQVYCITHKMHISQEFAFLCGSLFSVMRHNYFVPLHLKLYMLWTKRTHQSANFRTCDCSHEN